MIDPLRQHQFLTVLDRDEALRRFRAHLDLTPLASETVSLSASCKRVLATDVRAPVDVPGFDRSNVDGFAVQAEDTFGQSEDKPVILAIDPIAIAAGIPPCVVVGSGRAVSIATGGVLPRGAGAVVMIEFTEVRDARLVV